MLCALAASDRKIRQEIDLYAKGLPIDQTCDSDSANEAIVHRLSEIDAAYNVRAFIPELEKTYLSPERVAKYDKAIVDAVRAGVTWADVCSPGFRERSKRLKDATTGLVGRYTVRVLPNSVPLLNFIILRYKDRREEVWIGWSIEPPADAKARTFRITDPDVVAKFMEWHRALLRMAKDC